MVVWLGTITVLPGNVELHILILMPAESMFCPYSSMSLSCAWRPEKVSSPAISLARDTSRSWMMWISVESMYGSWLPSVSTFQ